MKKSFTVLSLLVVITLVIGVLVSKQWSPNDFLKTNLEVLTQSEQLPEVDCLPEGDGCEVVVKFANGVHYSVVFEDAHNVE
jgi:hypothetical protein